ncbi:activator of Hsp90 ATPase [Dichotomocladium elegans]|nr:activator of Hsp90 ATPase [Dichotomocladium elegans]
MSNWKNVNNWHWTNKNCQSWAQKYFAEQLEGLEAKHDGHIVRISKMNECTGDVDLNQRKGKIITIYDVALKLSLEGTLADGTPITGTLTVPEVAHDSDKDDYVFEIAISEDSPAKSAIKPVIRKHLTPLLCEKFSKFAPDMIATHGSDVYIDPSKLNDPASSTGATV